MAEVPLDKRGESDYLDILNHLKLFGEKRDDRTGVGTRAIFTPSLDFDLRDGRLPLLTTKKIHTKSLIHELLWFIKGSTNVRELQAQGVRIWDEWADPETGELGPVYGHQWRMWQRGIDQLGELIHGLKTNPHGRRHIVTAWNPSDLPYQKLPPCHCFFQCFVSDEGLILSMYQRSADWFLGVPFNIASYAMLTHMIAQVCGMKARGLHITFGDAHLYNNHHEQVEEQLKRAIRPQPRLILNPAVDKIDDFTYSDFTVEGYDPWPTIRAPVAV